MWTLTVLTEHSSAARDHLHTKPCSSSSADMLKLCLNPPFATHLFTTKVRGDTLKESNNVTIQKPPLTRHWQETPTCHDSCSTSHVVLVSLISVCHNRDFMTRQVPGRLSTHVFVRSQVNLIYCNESHRKPNQFIVHQSTSEPQQEKRKDNNCIETFLEL